MITKDLIHIANILLDCEEMSGEGREAVKKHVNSQCKRFRVTEAENDILKIIDRCHPGYNVGATDYDFGNKTIV